MRNRMKTSLLMLLLISLTSATIINVPGDQSTIQAGINASVNGDTVLVQPGTYIENINFNGKNLVLGSLFLVLGDTSYISSTIIDGNQNGSVVTFNSEENSQSVLSGLTISNGRAYSGGGIDIIGSNPTITHCNIINNTSDDGGGGIQLDQIVNVPYLSDLIVSGNHSGAHGGGIYIKTNDPDLLFEWANLVFYNNTSSLWGGALKINSSILLNNAVFNNNSSGRGGAILGADNADIYLNNVTMINNSVWVYGGGIFNDGGGNTYITNSILWNNIPEHIYQGDTISIQYSDIEGGYDGNGNIDLNPFFNDVDGIAFKISDYSPCIGSGTIVGAPTTDIEGNPRPNPVGSNPDMGAYENSLATPLYNSLIHVTITGNDTTGTGLSPTPFRTVQKGIDIAENGDTVLIHPGAYVENINFNGKSIVVGSEFITTQDTSYILQTIIDGNQNGRVVTFDNNENTAAILRGLSIRNGNATGSWPDGNGGGILCYGSSPTIDNVRVINNTAQGAGGGICYDNGCNTNLTNALIFGNTATVGGGIECSYSTLNLKNVVIANNQAINFGGISFDDEDGPFDGSGSLIHVTINGNIGEPAVRINDWTNSTYIIINSIIWNNSIQNDAVILDITYSNIQGGWVGEGNINIDPRFVNSINGDYHLSNYSPLIGAGLDTLIVPTDDIEGNPRPNPAGSNPDIGAFENPLATPIENSIIHVSTTGNDSGSVGLESAPFEHIQKAIDYSYDTDTVLVHPGTYFENINFNGKNIVVGSEFLTTQETSFISSTIIDGNQNGSVVTIVNGEELSSLLIGFTIRNGRSTSKGGGILIRTASTQISNCIIRNNSNYGNDTPDDGGGGIAIDYDGFAHINNCVIKDNVAYNGFEDGGHGGGLYVFGNYEASSDSTVVENCIITNNVAARYGGAILNFAGLIAINNCLIYGNSASNGEAINNEGKIIITNSTIANNQTGSSVSVETGQNMTIINSIIWEDSSTVIFTYYPDDIKISYSDIRGGWVGNGNINIDPRFVNSINGDYHLSNYSPLIGAGLDTLIVPTDDIDGNPRPNPTGTNPDMGAYENELGYGIIDTIAPVAGVIYLTDVINGNIIESKTTVNCLISGFSDDISGIANYYVGIGTKVNNDDAVPLTSFGLTNDIQLSGLNLSDYSTYYLTAIAVDSVGNISDTISSNPFIVYSQYLGDYDSDRDIDVEDLASFISIWPGSDLGPVTGEVPYLIPSPDGVANLRDIMTFTRMWHWSRVANDTAQMFISRNFGPTPLIEQKGKSLFVTPPEQTIAGEIIVEHSQDTELSVTGDKITENTIVLSKQIPDKRQLVVDFGFLGEKKPIKIDIKSNHNSNSSIQIHYRLFEKNGLSFSEGVQTIELTPVPVEFSLHQNYPNPFNPTTTIRYDLPEATNVHVVIYDLLGRQVIKLVNEFQDAGYRSITWNGQNSSGQTISAGMYFYTIKAGKNTSIKKMVLLK